MADRDRLQQRTVTMRNVSPSREDRTLDDFLEVAYLQTRTGMRQWKYWCILLSLGVANSSDAAEILCLSYILSDAEFQTTMLQGQNGGILAAAVFCGMLVGGLFIGTLGDWFGRKPMLLVGLGCNVMAGLLSSLAPSVAVLTLLRWIAGVGIGATVPPLFTLATELAPPSRRGLCVTICASFWMVGSIYVALVAMLILEYLGGSWRVFAMACAIPSAAGAFLVVALVPESPRFLALGTRHSEALTVANALARSLSYRGSPLTLEEMERSFPRSQAAGPVLLARQDVCTVVETAMVEFCRSTRQLYLPQTRKTTWPLQLIWFSLSFGSYGLVTWINALFVQVHLQNVYFNALLFAASNLPGNLLTALWMDKVGRSSMLISSVLAAAASLLAFAWCAKVMNPTGIVLSACSFQCFTIAAWNVIDTLSSELFPTAVRSTGMGVCAASGRIGAMLAQFVNGALVERPIRLLLVASGTLLLGAVTPCLLPHGDITGQPVQDVVSNNLTVEDTLYTPVPRPLDGHSPRGSDESSSYQSLTKGETTTTNMA